uniref:Integrase catalytic domain-containing protein n=1 Tax=Anopheles atroparvus TaxID=41427 RepID=A0AAG5DIV5_ANOAO
INGRTKVDTFALLDTGASSTLIEQTMANRLKLKGNVDPITLTWTQNLSVEETNSRRVECRIKGTKEGKEYSLQSARTVKRLDLPTQSMDTAELQQRFPHLKGINVMSYDNARPTVLIGLNNNHLMVPLDQRIGKNREPTAIKTKLGWTIFGVDSCSYHKNPQYLMIHEAEETMNNMIRSYFSTENFGVQATKPLLSHEEARVKEIIEKTLVRKEDRYEIGLLWKSDQIQLPASYQNAFSRLQSLEKQLKRDNSLFEWAKNTFQEYQQKGYLRKLTSKEVRTRTPHTFYLPHFIVINKNKPKPKPRLVFDAAAKVKDVSLNSALMSGPDINAPLFGVLVRFREGNICITGDIKEMFHQVQIRKEDQDAQRILWRDCENREPDVYVMQVMTFGATCSPACAQIVKNHNAEKFKDKYPKAKTAIVRQHYVDDYLDSFTDISEARETVRQVIEVHKKGGFEIRNFISNSKELLKTIPAERKSIENPIVMFKQKECNVEKVLGVYWDKQNDQIGYKVNLLGLGSVKIPTKRQILSFVMSVYDPLGLISHITIHGRLLVRTVNRAIEEWDTPIPAELQQQWNEWLDMARSAQMISIPRAIATYPATNMELHTFVDASEDAFAACIYLRSRHEGGYTVRLLVGKSKVAPSPILSIPRLELQAAVLGARLTETVKQELRLNVEKVTYWSDSQTVLAWINSVDRKYHQFVAVRISEILDSSTMKQWRWVPTKKNPADIATKKVDDDSAWFNGPEFLQSEESVWPVSKANTTTNEEARFIAFHHENNIVIDEDRYSYWDKMLRHLTYLKKFVDYVRNKEEFKKDVSVLDVQQVKNRLYRKAQWEGFPEEMKALVSKKEIQKASSINKLLPYLDEDGVMRSQGRLENITALPLSARKPIILPQKHRITKLIVRHYHNKSLHQADNVVISTIREHFWILNLRAVLKNVKKCCQICILHGAKPAAPLMAPLPECRATPYTPPFTHTGVDYFGPLEVTVKRSIEKRWGTIFTCMTTRAVYIDLADKLDTDSFLVCLKNVQFRRGKIAHLYSDNGTNFKGAEKELERLLVDINNHMGHEAALQHEIQWHFNPPSAPHFGGAWERQIQTIKKALRHMSTQWNMRKPSPETLRATLVQIEALLNSRPLTHIPLGNEGDEVLTPFHFIIGRSGEHVPPAAILSSKLDRKQYQLAQHNTKIFWDQWKKDYLPTLIQRNKWTKRVEPIKENDIVVLTDDNAPPGKWLKGRVVRAIAAPDGQVRSVEVKTGNTILKRPAVKVAVVNVEQKEHLLLHTTSTPPSIKRSRTPDTEPQKEPSAKPRVKRIAPCNWAQKLMLTLMILGVPNTHAYNIHPVEEGGILFNHLGTCLIQRGIMTKRIPTDINPRADTGNIHQIRFDLRALHTEFSKTHHLQEHTLKEAVAMVYAQSRAAEREIQFSTRVKRRVGGILGFLKDMIVGGDDVQQELEKLQSVEEIKFKQILSSLNTVKEKIKRSRKGFQRQKFKLVSATRKRRYRTKEIAR